MARRLASMSLKTRSTCAAVSSTTAPRRRRYPVVHRVEAKVHAIVRQREVELLLSLRHREGVGGRRPAADLLRDAEVFRQLVDLGLVEVRDRLHVGGAVALLDEEALVVLEAVRRAGDRVVQAVGVVVLGHLAHALLVVGGGDDLQIGRRRKAHGAWLALRALNRETGDVESLASRIGGQHELAFPAIAVLRNDAAYRLVLAAIAAKAFKSRRDVFENGSMPRRSASIRPRCSASSEE